MSQIKGVNKSETKVIYTISKDNDFFKQMTKVLLKLGLENKLPAEFPTEVETDEDLIDLTSKNDFYNESRTEDKDITMVYGNKSIFVIAIGTEKFIVEFNKYFNEVFSF